MSTETSSIFHKLTDRNMFHEESCLLLSLNIPNSIKVNWQWDEWGIGNLGLVQGAISPLSKATLSIKV